MTYFLRLPPAPPHFHVHLQPSPQVEWSSHQKLRQKLASLTSAKLHHWRNLTE